MLKDILENIAEDYGHDITEGSDDRAKIIAKVNRAAKEIHNAHDIREALDEDVFNINVSAQQIVFPNHVGVPRYARWHTSREKIELEDVRNRYDYEIEANEPWHLNRRS